MSQIPAILIAALIQVESGGNDRAIGDGGRSLGCLQISDVVVADVRRITGRWVSRTDAWSRQKSIRICVDYLSHYATRERLGYEPRMEDMARIWNGGPNGWRKDSTRDYWRKVQSVLTAGRRVQTGLDDRGPLVDPRRHHVQVAQFSGDRLVLGFEGFGPLLNRIHAVRQKDERAEHAAETRANSDDGPQSA